jgi:hypothetical protein
LLAIHRLKGWSALCGCVHSERFFPSIHESHVNDTRLYFYYEIMIPNPC